METKEKVNTRKAELLTHDVCPNCWGQQEYDDQVRIMRKDKQIAVANGEAHYAFIQQFVKQYLEGFHRVNSVNGKECPTCKTLY